MSLHTVHGVMQGQVPPLYNKGLLCRQILALFSTEQTASSRLRRNPNRFQSILLSMSNCNDTKQPGWIQGQITRFFLTIWCRVDKLPVFGFWFDGWVMRKKKTPGPMGWVGPSGSMGEHCCAIHQTTTEQLDRKRMRVHTRLGRTLKRQHLAWCVHCVGCDELHLGTGEHPVPYHLEQPG